jgi:NDP-sugar pyrophosphorylase family protein/aminoglycoside/choline kinase family phosphotransferase
MINLSVFILAAGLGERLRPVTNHIPKPLLPVMGKPVLESVLEKLSALPITSIGVNLHYKKEAIEKWITQSAFSSKVVIFPEDPVLGTGGALKNAERFLKDGDFLVYNADILSDINIERLTQFHRESGNLATLSVHSYPKFNNLSVDHTGQLIEIGAMCSLCRKPGSRLLAFTGIAVYTPEFLKILPEGASSIVHSWTKAISSGQKIGTYDVTGCYWTDIGTPASYAKAVINELKNNGETVYVHPSVKSCRNADIDGYVAIERKSFLNSGVSLRNCIVLPGTEIEKETVDNASPECFLTLFWGKGPGDTTHTSRTDAERTSFENCILGPDFTIALKESDLFDISVDNFILIGTGGSDRKYFRGRKNGSPAVLMQCTEGDTDYDRHIEYTQFFRNYSIPVPELIDVEPDRKRAFFEDIGDLSLYSWLKCPREEDDLEEMYRKVIDIMVLLHSSATEHISECPSLQKRIFDYKHLRWETSYFIERFVNGIPGIKIDYGRTLNDEFHELASKVYSFHKTIVHRDFQSQNIMITKGGIPRLLDYQGARIGPPAYDVVSILWDPYYRLDGSIRERLLNYYIGRMSAVSGWFNKKDFRETILPCRLQRHMQALGAYRFLSSAKGKRYFLKYIPEGLRLIREDLHETGQEYPALNSLINKL